MCISAGDTESASYQLAQAFAGVLNAGIAGTRWTAEPRSAAADDITLVTSGACDLAFAPGDIAAAAVRGGATTRAPTSLRALARLYETDIHLVVPAGSRINEVGDLAGRTVSVGPRGSATEFAAQRVLAAAGLPVDSGADGVRRLDLPDAIDALDNHRVDAFFWEGEPPVRTLEGFARRVPIRLVDLSPLVGELRQRYQIAYLAATITAKTYALNADAHTVGLPTFLVASATMDSTLAYQVTELLFTHRADLIRATPELRQVDVSSAIATEPVALHTGALRYYRQLKP